MTVAIQYRSTYETRRRPIVNLIFQGQTIIPGMAVGDTVRTLLCGHFVDVKLKGLKEKAWAVLRTGEAMRYHADVELTHWSGCPCSSTFERGSAGSALAWQRAREQAGYKT